MMRNNYRYSVTLLDHCQDNDIPFLYASSASVYGAGTMFREERASTRRRSTSTAIRSSCSTSTCGALLPERTAQVAGFRYFNVYGPREAHKGRMAVGGVRTSSSSIATTGRVRLFAGSGGYADGRAAPRLRVRRRRRRREPRLSRRIRSAPASSTSAPATRRRSTRVAVATINACRAAAGESAARARGAACAMARSSTSPLPPALVGKYQSFTAGRSHAACAPPGMRRRCCRSTRACARYVERLISRGQSIRKRERCVASCAANRAHGVDVNSPTDEGRDAHESLFRRSRWRSSSQSRCAARQPQHRHQGRARRAAGHRPGQGAGHPRLPRRSTADSSRSTS